MRKQQVTMFVSLLVLVVAAAAQTPSQLDRVNVVRGTDEIRVEMSSQGTLTPKLSKLQDLLAPTKQRHSPLDKTGL